MKHKKFKKDEVLRKLNCEIERQEGILEECAKTNRYGQNYYEALDRLERLIALRAMIKESDSKDNIIHRDYILLASISVLEGLIMLFGTDIGMRIINKTVEMRSLKAANLLSKVKI